MIRPNFMKMDESLWTPDEQIEAERRRRNFMRFARVYGACWPTMLAASIAVQLAEHVSPDQRGEKT